MKDQKKTDKHRNLQQGLRKGFLKKQKIQYSLQVLYPQTGEISLDCAYYFLKFQASIWVQQGKWFITINTNLLLASSCYRVWGTQKGGNIFINNNHMLTSAVQLDFEDTRKEQNTRRKQTQKARMKGMWGRPRQKRDHKHDEGTWSNYSDSLISSFSVIHCIQIYTESSSGQRGPNSIWTSDTKRILFVSVFLWTKNQNKSQIYSWRTSLPPAHLKKQ